MPNHEIRADRGGPEPTGQDRPGYHDPLAGLGGAAPAQSALTLRLVLAVVGLVCGIVGAAALSRVNAPTWAVALLVLVAVTAVVDVVVIVRRKRRGESG